MSWAKLFQGWRRVALLMAVSLIAGCASSPKTDPADVAEEERLAKEAELKQEFSEAVALLRGGDADNARDLLEQIHQSDPERTGPLANLGIIALQEGNAAEAEAYFRQVIERDLEHSAALTHLGVMAREQGEFDQAETLYRQALEADPDHLPAMLNLAILLDIYLGRLEEALPLYEQYQSLAEEPNPRLKDWIFDVRNRL